MSQKVGEWGYKCDNRHIVLNNLKLVTTGIDYLNPKRLSSTPTHQHHNPHHIHRRISFQKFQQRLIDHCSYQWNTTGCSMYKLPCFVVSKKESEYNMYTTQCNPYASQCMNNGWIPIHCGKLKTWKTRSSDYITGMIYPTDSHCFKLSPSLDFKVRFCVRYCACLVYMYNEHCIKIFFSHVLPWIPFND